MTNIITRETYLILKTNKIALDSADPVEEKFLNNNSRIFYE